MPLTGEAKREYGRLWARKRHGVTGLARRIAASELRRKFPGRYGLKRDRKTKSCPRCHIVKPIEAFNLARGRYDGHASLCSPCSVVYRTSRRSLYPQKTWAVYCIRRHKLRGFRVDISSDDLTDMALLTKACPLCNVPLHYIGRFSQTSATLDRKDNSDTITAESVWIICTRCNASKQDRSMTEFVEYCERVVRSFGKHLIPASPPSLIQVL